MAKHRGAYIRKLIDESEYSVTEVARLISVGRNTLYRWMEDEHLQLKKMVKVAESIGADISLDFPEVEKLKTQRKKQQLTEESNDDSLTMKTKYMLLLEKHTKLLEEMSQLKEEMAKYRKSDEKSD